MTMTPDNQPALPELPKPETVVGVVMGDNQERAHLFTADQMRAYALESLRRVEGATPVAWWNGQHQSKLNDLDPSIHWGGENSSHDIPLFAGCNPHSEIVRKAAAYDKLMAEGATLGEGREWPAACDWPDKPFTVNDMPGEHDPCYLIMPDGAMLAFVHHNTNGVDQARAKFVADTCNSAKKKSVNDERESQIEALVQLTDDVWCKRVDLDAAKRRVGEILALPTAQRVTEAPPCPVVFDEPSRAWAAAWDASAKHHTAHRVESGDMKNGGTWSQVGNVVTVASGPMQIQPSEEAQRVAAGDVSSLADRWRKQGDATAVIYGGMHDDDPVRHVLKAQCDVLDRCAHDLEQATQAPPPTGEAVGEVRDAKYHTAFFYKQPAGQYLQPGTKLYTHPAAQAEGRFDVFARAIGANTEPYPDGLPNPSGLRYKYQYANDLFAAWNAALTAPADVSNAVSPELLFEHEGDGTKVYGYTEAQMKSAAHSFHGISIALDATLGPNQIAVVHGGKRVVFDITAPADVEVSPACAHNNTTTHYDCVTCNDCGAIHTDSDWGIARNQWFKSRSGAEFYKKNGRLPEPPK